MESKNKLKEIKKIYLDWYNTDLSEEIDAVKTLYAIGEKLKEITIENKEGKEDVTIKEKIEAQRNYAHSNAYPLFAPNDGVCFDCNKQIFNKITLKKAESELITGCPYCNASYCE